MAETERAAAPKAKRYPGKPIAIGLATFLIVGTALTTYFAWRGEVARQRAFDTIQVEHPDEVPETTPRIPAFTN